MWVLDPRTNEIVEKSVHECGTITFSKDGVHFRTEYSCLHDARFGTIHFYADGRLVRTEYEPFHPDYTNVVFHLPDGTERIEMGERDEAFGTIEHWKHGKLFCITYTASHVCHGEIETWRDDRHVCTEYADFHSDHGKVEHYDEYGVQVVRRSYTANHSEHGRVEHLDPSGRITRIEFTDPHSRSGTACHFADDEIRLVFACTHPQRGQAVFFSLEGEYRKTTYGLDDEVCSVI